MRGSRRMLAAFAALALICPTLASPQADTNDRGAQRMDISMHVREAAQRFGLPEHWIYAVIRFESAGRTRAVSAAAAAYHSRMGASSSVASIQRRVLGGTLMP